jgi:lipoic acid synthetase
MGLTHVVLTSVNRDDLADGGSLQFERAITAVRSASPGATIEVLTPDFQGSEEAIDRVVAARPDVYNHNLETVPRLYRNVRPGARYARSLDLLERVARVSGGPISKSGLMLGLGETEDEVHRVMRDLRSAGVSCLTLGQYLQPTLRHLQVERYLDPAEFETLREHATALGFEHVASGPLVRSSFDAGSGLRLLREARGARVSV